MGIGGTYTLGTCDVKGGTHCTHEKMVDAMCGFR
jgi:hypothetical protein